MWTLVIVGVLTLVFLYFLRFRASPQASQVATKPKAKEQPLGKVVAKVEGKITIISSCVC